MQKLQERVAYSVLRQDWIDDLGQRLQSVVKETVFVGKTGQRVKDFLHGVWLAHPLHSAVTDVPVGAWTAALTLDSIESVTGQDMRGASSAAIGLGIGGAVVAAASGIADWSDTSGAQRRVGLLHASLNIVALALYSISLARRLSGRHSDAKLFSTIGWSTVLVSAYLGGDLAYRLGTQVDRNAWRRGPEEFEGVMREADLQEGRLTRAQAGDIPVLLVRQGSRIYAMSDICAHAGCSLSDGKLNDGKVTCICHGSTYRLEDGTVVHGPAVYAQPHFEVRVQNGQIEIRTAVP